MRVIQRLYRPLTPWLRWRSISLDCGRFTFARSASATHDALRGNTATGRFVFTFALLALIAATAVAAQAADGLLPSPEPDWPQWRGMRRDGISSEQGLLPQWPEGGPPLLWAVDGLGVGWSSPIIVGQRIYITGDVEDDLVIFAYDRGGDLAWRVKNGAAWKGSFPGARACCCYSAGRLYHLNAHGRLVCLDADTGKELWNLDICQKFDAQNITWALSECLLVDGDRLVVTPGGRQALMAALDKVSGQVIWTTPPLEDDLTSYSSPILFQYGGRRVIANCSSAHGFAVDADRGQLLWTVPLRNPHKVNASTPLYQDGSIFFVTPYGEEGRNYRLKIEGERMTAELAWQSPLDSVTGSGVVVNGMLFAAGYRKNKWWMGIDWTTGLERSQLKDFTTGAAIHADDRLYILDERGAVGLLAADQGQLSTVGKFQLVADRVTDAWAHPVLLDGRLYLRYHDRLWCYDVRRTDR